MTSQEGLITIASMFQYLHIGELLIFSLCLIMIQIKTRAVYVWIFSNLVALCGTTYALSYISSGGQSTNAIGGSLILFSSALKALSFSDRSLFGTKNKIPTILLFLGIIFTIFVLISGDTNYRLLLVSISGIFMSMAAILYLLFNKNWIGLYGVKYSISVLISVVMALIFLMSQAFPIGEKTRFIPADSSIPYHVITSAVLIFFFHMAFIGLIVGRRTRENMFQSRRSIRIKDAIIKSKSKESESAVLADERHHLLKMLTHEVRQPMNSAQAALQALAQKISAGNDAPEYIKNTIENTTSTLNAIILSISNSILGATLITKGRVQKLELTDVCCVVELALLDIDLIEARRFEKVFEQPVMFTDADPIILRLGVRNLLENAVKYSPRHSKVLLKVETDDEHLTVVISVTNKTDGFSMLGPDIFNQARRGVDKKYDGYGLGLYITKEVAKLHRGSLCCQQNNDKSVTFELALPA